MGSRIHETGTVLVSASRAKRLLTGSGDVRPGLLMLVEHVLLLLSRRDELAHPPPRACCRIVHSRRANPQDTRLDAPMPANTYLILSASLPLRDSFAMNCAMDQGSTHCLIASSYRFRASALWRFLVRTTTLRLKLGAPHIPLLRFRVLPNPLHRFLSTASQTRRHRGGKQLPGIWTVRRYSSARCGDSRSATACPGSRLSRNAMETVGSANVRLHHEFGRSRESGQLAPPAPWRRPTEPAVCRCTPTAAAARR